ncbi:helix-turn-helix domain-containing protein [Nocardia jiangxiensis]|uniref:Helix-turn-helix domain-containing protein n=1 Tax=Nocardia jiangxiensis TaxID=282685 RepID=A0ABW6S395_9NOCA|nr:helix-turn-helix transcriptional regulator [Nocardia jiangxiensis]
MFINVADSQTTDEDLLEQDSAEVLSPRQVAATIFSSRLSDLIAESVVSTEDGLTRSLTLYTLAQHLELAYPDVPVSQSGLYRLIHGEAIPRLDLIIALARVFDVPPEYFVTPDKNS